ncbi:hypothetical protein [Zunongwangia atlantica]|uniref:Fibronectin type-III domain-containing protein n=1 Tax=Zunongwangia atlantica 22II14-10F7 TaxID=1185767 RepID=A0A1Y1T5E3_9FLAO|nr:hypothetical protein [Zunongwangia atlantica]ORL46248.1 hypothetical protein IIF7_06751 [Zunongwangia atlantica 22II14-10F7]
MKIYLNALLQKNYVLFFLIVGLFSCSEDSTVDNVPTEPEVSEDISIASLSINTPIRIAAHSVLLSGEILNDGGGSVTERGVCFSLNEGATIETGHQIASLVRGSGEFETEIQGLEDGEDYYLKAYAVNEKGVGYSEEIIISTPIANPPVFENDRQAVAGAHDVFFYVNLLETGEGAIEEIGLVWGENENPTLEDHVEINEDLSQSYLQRISGLDSETTYYVRPYAQSRGNIIYGDQEQITTIKPGNFTFWMQDVPTNADQETIDAYGRIRAAFESATNYYNNYTSIEKHVTVNYSPGTPTADGSFSGNIRVGTNQGYQRTGTALHEMAHTVGIGTHNVYWDLMNGSWEGANAPRILKVMTAGAEATVSGDGTHFWPYGINGAHEDTGEEMLYIIHAMIMQGFKLDGLPSN